MSKVLFIYERNIPTVSLTYNNFTSEYAKARGIDASFKCVKSISKKDINNFDVFFFIRPTDIISKKLATKIRKAGGFIIIFCDDDLMDYPDDFPGIPYRIKCTKRVLECANVVLSSSKHFVDKYVSKSFGKRTALINTCVDSNELVAPEENIDVIKILYAGSPTHLAMFNENIKPIFNELVKNFGKRISFTFIGVRPELEEYEQLTNIEYVASMPLEEYRNFVKNGHYHIGLAPLFDSEFSKSKYFNKYIEYTLIGATGIYSNVEPYSFVIKDGVNGLLVDKKEDWFSKLALAITNNTLRNQMINNAQIDIEKNFNKEAIFDELINSIIELKEYNNTKNKVSYFKLANKINYFSHRVFDIMYLLFFYIKHTGISGLKKKIKAHNRDKKSIKDLEEN